MTRGAPLSAALSGTALVALAAFAGSAFAASAITTLQAELAARRTVIEAERKSLNADCAAVPPTQAGKVAECRQRQRDVVRGMDQYMADLNRLRALQDAAGEELVAREQAAYRAGNAAWAQEQRRFVEARLKTPNERARALQEALLAGAPPPSPPPRPAGYPPPTGFSTLKPGDILLVAPEERPWWNSASDAAAALGSTATAAGDNVSSLVAAPVSHTVLFLKEVNGTKLFLDHTPGEGGHVISEKQFFARYGERETFKAGLAQPLATDEARRLWQAAKEFQKKEAQIKADRRGNVIDQTGYGVYGKENLVCSEADRWVLAQAGRNLADTASPVKRFLGIHYGPANIYADRQHFVVTPLYAAVNDKQ